MNYWKNFWETYRSIEIKSEDDMLYQVALTVNGKPISSFAFKTIVDDIVDNLKLNNNDVVLDLCCGNGLITSKVADNVKIIIGIDFSESMLNVANKFNLKVNIQFHYCDLNDELKVLETVKNLNFTKVYMYQSLAYFKKQEFNNLLMLCSKITSESASIFIGGILDTERKWKFYKTVSLKLLYLYNYLTKKDPVGQWYSKKEIKNLAEKYGYNCQIISQKKILHTAHYRFDVLLTKRNIYE